MPSRSLAGAWALAALMAACADVARPTQGAEDMEQLKTLVLKKDPAATLRAKSLGRPAGPVLRDLAKNPDAGVRLLALQCLGVVGGPDAVAAFTGALTDGDEQVAGEAGGALLDLGACERGAAHRCGKNEAEGTHDELLSGMADRFSLNVPP